MIAREYPPLRDKPVNSTYLPVYPGTGVRGRIMTRRRCHTRVRHRGAAARRRRPRAEPASTGQLSGQVSGVSEIGREVIVVREVLAFRTAARPQIRAFRVRSERRQPCVEERQTIESLLTRSKVPAGRFWRNDRQSFMSTLPCDCGEKHHSKCCAVGRLHLQGLPPRTDSAGLLRAPGSQRRNSAW